MKKIFKNKDLHISKKIKYIILLILIFIFTIAFIVYGFKIINEIKDYNENQKIFDEISKDITVQEINDETIDNEKYNIDFNNLKRKNSDTIGFLKVNGTDIEQVVVKGNDNSYYLDHNFDKQINSAGWIFADYHNKFDGTDKNIIIYGHNMKNNSMFGTLLNVLDSNWQQNEENHNVTFFTENSYAMYSVFSVYKIPVEDYYIKTDFKNSEFKNFCSILKNRSMYDFNIDVDENDQILTLSTCANNNQYRVVLHAKKYVNTINSIMN